MNNLKTGDLLLFCGRNNIISDFIKYYLGSKYTHVAIYLKNPTYLDENLLGDYVLECGYEPGKIFGVQITPLKDLLHSFPGNIYYRKLKTSLRSLNLGIYLNVFLEKTWS